MRACYTLMGHFGGLLGCGARRWGREDVVVLTGGAVVLGAGALLFWFVLVVGGAGVLLLRSVCFGGAGVVHPKNCFTK